MRTIRIAVLVLGANMAIAHVAAAQDEPPPSGAAPLPWRAVPSLDRVGLPLRRASALVFQAPDPCCKGAGRVTRSIVAGTIVASLVGLVAWKAVDNPGGSDRRVKGDAGYTPNANTAYALGSWLGSTLAVHLAGRRYGACGSLARAALGAGIPTAVLLLGRDEPILPVLGVLFGAPAQSLGATIAH
ncbi:MAG: hypothetical protein IT360_14120 [Gemmatimonadaceae bacterium]|nr:hypothetical protein [Gemmatimonadaceae bacterium]